MQKHEFRRKYLKFAYYELDYWKTYSFLIGTKTVKAPIKVIRPAPVASINPNVSLLLEQSDAILSEIEKSAKNQLKLPKRFHISLRKLF